MPIGIAFWINGLLADWDPVTITASNTTVTTDGAYENVTTSRSLHPCTDAAELSLVAVPAGVTSNTPANQSQPAPSVRAELARRVARSRSRTRAAALQIWKAVFVPKTDSMTVMHADVTVRGGVARSALALSDAPPKRFRSKCFSCWTTTRPTT